MGVTIEIQKTVILDHLMSEIALVYGRVDFIPPSTLFVQNTNNTNGVTAIYNAHTGFPYPAEIRLANSRATAKAIPNWVSWSQADWITWYNANISPTQINAVTNIATAIVVLRAMGSAINALAQMAIAVRDYIWSDLQDR